MATARFRPPAAARPSGAAVGRPFVSRDRAAIRPAPVVVERTLVVEQRRGATVTPALLATAPGQVTLTTPMEAMLRAEWASTGADGYRLWVRDKAGYETDLAADTDPWSGLTHVDVAPLAGTVRHDVTGLMAGTTYVVAVQSVVGVSISDRSTVAEGTAQHEAPGKPTVTATASTSVNNTIDVAWTAPANVASLTGILYYAEYRVQGTTAWLHPAGTVAGLLSAAQITAGTFAFLGTARTTYEFRVRADRMDALDGEWSDVVSDTTQAAVPQKVTGVMVSGVAATASRASYTATWTADAAATGYRVRWGVALSADTYAWLNPGGVTGVAVTGTSHTFTSWYISPPVQSPGYPPALQIYNKLQVRATSAAADGDWSVVTDFGIFRAGAAPPPTPTPGEPVPTSPPSTAATNVMVTASGNTLSVTWTNPSDATGGWIGYRVQGTSAWSESTGHTGSSGSVGGLIYATTYEVRVGATNAAGRGPWSVAPYPTAMTGTAPTVAPATPGTPSVGSVGRRMTIRWAAVPGAERYDVQQQIGTGAFRVIATVTGTSHTVAGEYDQTYGFRVRARNSAGNSAYSATATHAIGPEPVTDLAAPASCSIVFIDTGTRGVRLSWPAVTGVDTFEAEIRNGTTLSPIVGDLGWRNRQTVRGTRTAFFRGIRSHEFQGRVRSFDGTRRSIWRESAKIDGPGRTPTTPATLAAPSLIGDATLRADGRYAFHLQWNSITGAVGYMVEIRWFRFGHPAPVDRFHYRAGQTTTTFDITLTLRQGHWDYAFYVQATTATGLPAPNTKIAAAALGPRSNQWHYRGNL